MTTGEPTGTVDDDQPVELLPEPGAEATAAHALRWAMAEALQRFLAHEPGVRSGEDAEDVHQARVAMRRFRVILRQFRDFWDAKWADELRSEMSALADRLGDLRDADVMLLRLKTLVEQLAEADRAGGAALADRLAHERRNARRRLLRTLSGPAMEGLRRKMTAAVARPEFTQGADARAQDALRPHAASAWERLKEIVQSLPNNPSDDELHHVRIRTKRARYAAGVLVPILGKPASRFSDAAADVQDVLGGLQDAVVSSAWLRNAGSELGPPVAFVAGLITATEEREARRLRDRWPDAWRRLDRAKVTAWLET